MNSILVSSMCIYVQISSVGEQFVFRARGLGFDSFRYTLMKNSLKNVAFWESPLVDFSL